MPNAFSPNLDGINDIIKPLTDDGDITQIISYKIYNRWGVQVHFVENGSPNSPEIGWDGTYRNEPVMPGVYVYEIILEFRDGQQSLIKGDFTLIK
jgi:gliding motility-associated-like protein